MAKKMRPSAELNAARWAFEHALLAALQLLLQAVELGRGREHLLLRACIVLARLVEVFRQAVCRGRRRGRHVLYEALALASRVLASSPKKPAAVWAQPRKRVRYRTALKDAGGNLAQHVT